VCQEGHRGQVTLERRRSGEEEEEEEAHTAQSRVHRQEGRPP